LLGRGMLLWAIPPDNRLKLMYEFHYFYDENTSGIPDKITPLKYKNDEDAFVSLDHEQEYLHGSRSPYSVSLMKDGKNMSKEFLAWVGRE